MCDKELLVSYLYDELQGPERQTFEEHLGACKACSSEVQALRGTRAHLSSWAPVEPDLSFQIVRRAEVRPSRLRWSPAWGLAAAAVLVLGAAAGMANVEVRSGSEGIVVRTGWSRGPADSNAGAQLANASRDEMTAMERRLAELENALAAARPASVVTSSPVRSDTTRVVEADLLKRMRQLVDESETRTQREFAQRLMAGMRELTASHTNDLINLQQTMNQNQGAMNAEMYRQGEEMKNFIRLVGTQSPR